MVDDANPEVITRDEAFARVSKAALSSGVVRPLRFLDDQGTLSTDPDLRQMRLGLKVEGTNATEVRASFDKLQVSIDGTGGIQLIAAKRDCHDLPGAVITILYYGINTGTA